MEKRVRENIELNRKQEKCTLPSSKGREIPSEKLSAHRIPVRGQVDVACGDGHVHSAIVGAVHAVRALGLFKERVGVARDRRIDGGADSGARRQRQRMSDRRKMRSSQMNIESQWSMKKWGQIDVINAQR